MNCAGALGAPGISESVQGLGAPRADHMAKTSLHFCEGGSDQTGRGNFWGRGRSSANESTSQETSMTALEKLLGRLRALGPGHSGLVTRAELMKIEVPGVPDYHFITRAEWLQKQLPFSCSFQENTTTGDLVFKRP